MIKTTKQKRYQKRCDEAGIRRVHPQYRTEAHRVKILEYARALREGKLTDEDRMRWLNEAPGRLSEIGNYGYDAGMTASEAIDGLIELHARKVGS